MLVNNKGNFIRRVKGVMLVPGVNEISEEEWERAKSHKLFKTAVIDKGEVVAVEGNEEKEGATNTTDLNANEAIELVKETFNIDLLKGWQEQDSRKTVLQAIDEQIKFLYGNEDNEEEEV